MYCWVEEVNPRFEMLYGVYGVKVARKFVVLSVWVRVPVITQNKNSQVAIGCHSYIGGCITLPVMGSTGSSPVLTTNNLNKKSMQGKYE